MPETDKRQLCRITIMFPIDTDDKAVEYKKAITEIMSKVSDARIDFSLVSMPSIKGIPSNA
jgi:hypothetical protein